MASMMIKNIKESRRRLPKSFKLSNGIKVEFASKRYLLGNLSDFNYNFKHGCDVSDIAFYILTKDFEEITVSEDDFQYVKPSEIKSIYMVWEDGYLISDIDSVEFRYTKTDEPIDWDMIQDVPEIHDELELYFKDC